MKKKKEEQTAKIKAERDRISEITEKIKGGVPKDPLPLPTDYMTFQRFSQLSKDLKKKKGNGCSAQETASESATASTRKQKNATRRKLSASTQSTRTKSGRWTLRETSPQALRTTR